MNDVSRYTDSMMILHPASLDNPCQSASTNRIVNQGMMVGARVSSNKMRLSSSPMTRIFP